MSAHALAPRQSTLSSDALALSRALGFTAAFFGMLFLSRSVQVPGVPRYDLLFFCCVALQGALLVSGKESLHDLKTLSLFHVFALALEIFKTHPAIHSWTYPEASFFRVLGVPLYSGFMYAAVAAFMLHAMRELRLHVEGLPRRAWLVTWVTLVFLNFFTHHFTVDLRWPLTLWGLFLFRDARLHRHEPGRGASLLVVFAGFGLALWAAENLATWGGAWAYPHQLGGWHPVGFAKAHSWSLLAVLSFVIVVLRGSARAREEQAGARPLDGIRHPSMGSG